MPKATIILKIDINNFFFLLMFKAFKKIRCIVKIKENRINFKNIEELMICCKGIASFSNTCSDLSPWKEDNFIQTANINNHKDVVMA